MDNKPEIELIATEQRQTDGEFLGDVDYALERLALPGEHRSLALQKTTQMNTHNKQTPATDTHVK